MNNIDSAIKTLEEKIIQYNEMHPKGEGAISKAFDKLIYEHQTAIKLLKGRQGLVNNIREIVKYMLPEEAQESEDIIENYINTLVSIAEDYKSKQL